jgi:PPOX class probable F420-dependent enzyme
MTDDEIWAFLADGARTAKLATTRANGAPHVAPIWFVVDDRTIVFNTGKETIKGKALRREGRAALCVDDERPPYAFVSVDGTVEVSEELDEMVKWATRIGGRYMGADRAEEFGRRNGVPGELLVRLRPTHIVAFATMAD